MTRLRYYKYLLHHQSNDLSFHIFILKAFSIQKQEQTYLFLDFKAHSSIYYNPLLKVTDFIIRGSLNPIKKIVLQVLDFLPQIFYSVSFEKENIDLNVWLNTIQTLNNLIPEHIEF